MTNSVSSSVGRTLLRYHVGVALSLARHWALAHHWALSSCLRYAFVCAVLCSWSCLGHPQPPDRSQHGCTVGVNRDPPVWPSTQAGWWRNQSASPTYVGRRATISRRRGLQTCTPAEGQRKFLYSYCRWQTGDSDPRSSERRTWSKETIKQSIDFRIDGIPNYETHKDDQFLQNIVEQEQILRATEETLKENLPQSNILSEKTVKIIQEAGNCELHEIQQRTNKVQCQRCLLVRRSWISSMSLWMELGHV